MEVLLLVLIDKGTTDPAQDHGLLGAAQIMRVTRTVNVDCTFYVIHCTEEKLAYMKIISLAIGPPGTAGEREGRLSVDIDDIRKSVERRQVNQIANEWAQEARERQPSTWKKPVSM